MRIALLLLLAMMPAITSLALPHNTSLAARDLRPALIPLKLLRMPRSVFPTAAQVHDERSGNLAADAASELHTTTFGELGRAGGVIQTARWNMRVGRRNPSFTL